MWLYFIYTNKILRARGSKMVAYKSLLNFKKIEYIKYYS